MVLGGYEASRIDVFDIGHPIMGLGGPKLIVGRRHPGLQVPGTIA